MDDSARACLLFCILVAVGASAARLPLCPSELCPECIDCRPTSCSVVSGPDAESCLCCGQKGAGAGRASASTTWPPIPRRPRPPCGLVCPGAIDFATCTCTSSLLD
ncbi:uncharacterized protein LOC144128911 [Amblyomma americanum]